MQWNNGYIEKLERTIAQRVQSSGYVLTSEIRKAISTPGRSMSVATIKRGKNAGKQKTVWGALNTNPSAPGMPPHRQTGRLRASIAQDFDESRVISRVGSPMALAKWLELGTAGGKIIRAKNARSLANRALSQFFGKEVRQGAIAPRPFLRPTLTASQQMILDIIAGK